MESMKAEGKQPGAQAKKVNLHYGEKRPRAEVEPRPRSPPRRNRRGKKKQEIPSEAALAPLLSPAFVD